MRLLTPILILASGSLLLLVFVLPVSAQSYELPYTQIADGDLIKTLGNPDVYIVKIYGGKRFKRLILNPRIFNQYQHLKWEDIKLVTEGTLAVFVTSNLVRAAEDQRVWQLYPNGDVGVKRHIKTQADFAGLTCDWDAIFEMNQFERDSYNTEEGILTACPVVNWALSIGSTSSPQTGSGQAPATPPPSPSSSGTTVTISDALWRGEYWNLAASAVFPPQFPTASPDLVRGDADINFDWGWNAPATGMNRDAFAIRWTKSIALTQGTYTITFTGDDGFRLWVDGVLLIDKWISGPSKLGTAQLVSSGKAHQFKIEYYEQKEPASAKLSIVKKL